MMHKMVIIAGGSGVGKSTLAKYICQAFEGVTHLSQDNFCIDRSQLLLDNDFYELNHDVPDIIDFQAIRQCVGDLMSGKASRIPHYVHHKLCAEGYKMMDPGHVVYEGIHAFYDAQLLSMSRCKIFIDLPFELALERRIRRDTRHTKVDEHALIRYCHDVVYPIYRDEIAPLRRKADFIIDASDEKIYEDTCKIVTDFLRSP